MAMVLVTNIRRRRERGIGGICEWSDPWAGNVTNANGANIITVGYTLDVYLL